MVAFRRQHRSPPWEERVSFRSGQVPKIRDLFGKFIFPKGLGGFFPPREIVGWDFVGIAVWKTCHYLIRYFIENIKLFYRMTTR